MKNLYLQIPGPKRLVLYENCFERFLISGIG